MEGISPIGVDTELHIQFGTDFLRNSAIWTWELYIYPDIWTYI